MVSGPDLLNQLNTLYQVGVVGDLTDGELLQRLLNAQEGADQAVFTAMVERHGPMVLRVCRAVLRDHHDAQDAFQATFLILAKKAGAVRKADSVASWLHKVALRVAARARADAIRRKVHEQRSALMRAKTTGPTESWPEIHEEIARLPRRYREPVVLCYLEGLSTEAAAMRIGCPKGTLLSQLSRAREHLRGRLTRRGLAPPAVLAASSMTPEAMAALPLALVEATVRMSLGFAGLRANEAVLASAAATVLARGVLSAMMLSQLKILGAATLASVLALAGVQAFALQFGGTAKIDTSGPVSEDRQTVLTRSLDRLQAELDEVTRRNTKLRNELDEIRAELKRQRNAPAPVAPRNDPGGTNGRVSDASPALPKLKRFGQFIYMVSPKGDQIIYDTKTKESHSIRLTASQESPPEVQAYVTPIGVALRIKGSKISRIAVANSHNGVWQIQDLREPFEGDALPIFAPNAIAYGLGRYLYAFKPEVGWDVAELPAGMSTQPTVNGNDGFMAEAGGHVFTYDSRIGKWDDLNVGAIINSATEQEAGDARPRKP